MKKFIGTLTALCLVLTPCAGAAALSTTPTQTAAVTLEQLLNVTNDQFTPLVQNGTVYLPVQIIGEFLSKVFSWGFSGGTGATATTPVTSGQTASGNAITLDEAKAIALKDAGFSESQVTIVRARQDYDDGRLEYEVEFYKDNVEYDYEISSTGTILSRDYDAEGYAPAQTGNAMSMDKAKQLVLDRVPGATTSNIVQFKLDYDDGRQLYEGKLFYNGLEYEFEMDAVTGTFYDWEIDR